MRTKEEIEMTRALALKEAATRKKLECARIGYSYQLHRSIPKLSDEQLKTLRDQYAAGN